MIDAERRHALTKMVKWLIIVIVTVFFIADWFIEGRQQRAYDDAQRACRTAAPLIVPDVDPVAWCEP